MIIKKLILTTMAVAVAFSLTACNKQEENNKENVPSNPPVEETSRIDPDSLVLEFGDFHTPLQAAFLLDEDYNNITKYAQGVEDWGAPRAITLSWDAIENADKYYVELATDENYENSVVYESSETSYDLYNLYLACDYYWRVADSVEALAEADSTHFTTTSTGPRNIYIDGVTNVRDVGGWMTSSGVRVKQGLLYRGARLNASDTDDYKLEITEAGIELLNQLNIKTELDLRQTTSSSPTTDKGSEYGNVGENGNVEGVNYVHIPVIPQGNFLEKNPDEFKEIFALLADESSYPLYFHCHIGTDRTGLIAFLVNALLGVSEDDLYTDYLFSNFGNIGGARTVGAFQRLYCEGAGCISSMEGKDFAEKTENYLLSYGVITREQIESIRNILLG